MNVKDIIFTQTGTAIAKAVLGILFPDPITKAATTGIFEILKGRWNDARAASKGKIEFDKLAVEVAERLIPVFQREDIPENELAAVAQAITDRFHEYPFSSKRLAELNNSPEAFSAELLQTFEKATRDFSAAAGELYRRAVKLATQYVINIADLLPSHTTANFSEILERLNRLEENIHKVLDNVQRIHQTTPNEFEADFRQAVAREYDFMELFGADLDRASQRHQLTVAYISLTALELNERDEETQEEPVALRVEEAVASHKNILILGQAGSGKTTILKWLAVNLAQRTLENALQHWQNRVPFFIALRKIKDDKEFPMPEKWVALTSPTVASGQPANWTYEILKQGRGLIFIDGIDEVPQARRETARQWISQLKQSFAENVFVLTSRPAALQNLSDKKDVQTWQDWLQLETFHSFELQDLRDEDLRHFIAHWHKAVEKATPTHRRAEIDFDEYEKSIERALRNTPPLRRLAVNPLLCAMICALHFSRHMRLPEDRLDLYEKCIEMLLERDPMRGIDLREYPKFTLRQKKNLMSHLAYSMMRRSLSAIDYAGMKQLLANRLELIPDEAGQADPDKTCEYFLARTGLLREIARGEIDFAHRTFEEYLAAYAIVGAGELDALLKHAGDDQWHEVIVAAVGLAQDKGAEMIEKILAKNDVTSTILTLACLGTASNVSQVLQDRIKKEVAKFVPPMKKEIKRAIAAAGNLAVPALQYQKKRKANEAAVCAETLGLIGTDLALKELIPYLLDHRLTVARPALGSLRGDKPGKYLAFLLDYSIPKQLAEDSEIVEFIFAEILESVANENTLIQLLEQTPQFVESAINRIPFSRERTFALLTKSLKSEFYKVRRASVQTLMKLGTHEDLPQMIPIFKDSDPDVLGTIVQAFEKLGTHEDLPQVIPMLKNYNWDVRRAAVQVFEKLGTRENLPQVIPMLKDYNSFVRRAAVQAFEKLGTREDLPQMISMLMDSNSDVRRAVVQAFSKLATREDLPLVIPMLKNSDSDVRRAAVQFFEKLGTHQDLSQVIPMLKDSSNDVSHAAVQAFAKLVAREDLPRVIPLLKKSNNDICRAAVQAMERLGTHEDLLQVIPMIKDSNNDVCRAAVQAFAKLGTREDLPPLIPMLKDSEYDVRRAAVQVFEKLGIREDLPPVIPLLKDSEYDVRRAAMQVFEKLVTREDLPQMIPMLKDSDNDVRRTAVQVFGKLVTREDLPQVIPMLNDANIEIRHLAKVTIRKLTEENVQFLRQFVQEGASYPLDVKIYFKMAIEQPEWLAELNRRLVNAGEKERW